jgi:hypothetical protein
LGLGVIQPLGLEIQKPQVRKVIVIAGVKLLRFQDGLFRQLPLIGNPRKAAPR